MKRTAILAAAAVALSACTTTGSIDTTIQTSLEKTCPLIETGYSAFSVIAITGRIKKSTVAKVDAAHQAAVILCADPKNTTAADALIRLAGVYATISVALKEARAAE